MDSREIQDKNKLDYQRKQRNKIELPPLLRIGEYHPPTGRYEVLFPNGGKAIAGNKLFTSSVPNGTPVRATQTLGAQSIALDYRNHKPITLAQELPVLTGAMVWNLGYTRGGYANLAVDWFTGTTNRNTPVWQQSVSDSDEMPNIAGKKLVYVPLPTRMLLPEEIKRLKAFQKAGGIVFLAGDWKNFFGTYNQIINEILAELESPLRLGNIGIFYTDTNYSYPASFGGTVKTMSSVSTSEVIGGTPISVIPADQVEIARDVVWLAYDQASRTILSGDTSWASEYTTETSETPNDNAAFAQALMNVKW